MSSSPRLVRAKTAAALVGVLMMVATGPAGAASKHPQSVQSQRPGTVSSVTAIVLPVKGDITLTVDSKDAGDELGFGLNSPRHIAMCGNCRAGMKKDIGIFEVGTTMVFYLTDRTHHETFLSTNTNHAHVVADSPVSWTISWDDAGGDGDFNDLVTTIVLTSTP